MKSINSIESPARVLIPVYNGFKQAQSCIVSVLKHTPSNVKVFIVDDASPEGSFIDFIQHIDLLDSRLNFSRNSKNLGFVRTCNEFFKAQSEYDVIILNSDTRVTPEWFENLTRAAYSAPNIGTVTPFSNNATICSIPQFCKNNSMPPRLSETDFSEILKSIGPTKYPEIPTCVGFCTYIRRSLFQKIGFFNEEVFGRGYGEENDLSRRASKAGFKNILDPKTFVFHEGSASFGSEGDYKPTQNEKTLLKLHPEYSEVVRDFVSQNPLEPIHKSFSQELLRVWIKKFSGKHILHVLHNGPRAHWNGPLGGTERVVSDTIQECSEFGHWTLVPRKSDFVLSAHLGEFSFDFSFKRSPDFLTQLFKKNIFSLIHFHHLLGYGTHFVDEAQLKQIPYVASIHDFYWVCLRINLLTRNRAICDGKACLDSCFEDPKKIISHRLAIYNLIKGAEEIFYFSEHSKARIKEILNLQVPLKWTKTRHGLPPYFFEGGDKEPVSLTEVNSKFRVLFLGPPTSEKGFDLFRAAKDLDRRSSNSNIEWMELVNYKREKLPKKVRELNPDVICLLSRVPETYSITLDEASALGIPTLVTPVGALAERCQDLNLGWVLGDFKPETLLETLKSLSRSGSPYSKVKVNLMSRAHALLTSETTKCYWKSYSQLLKDPFDQFNKIESLLLESGPRPQIKRSGFWLRFRKSRFFFYFSRFKILRKIKRFLTGN